MRAEDVVNSWEMWPQQVLAMNNCLHNLWITCCLETVVILISYYLYRTYTYIYVNISYLQINVPWGSYLGVSEVSHFAVIKQLEVSSNRGTPSHHGCFQYSSRRTVRGSINQQIGPAANLGSRCGRQSTTSSSGHTKPLQAPGFFELL